jgi:hypothetical protein
MDLDAYTAAHRDEWDRLAVLDSKRTLPGAEADELIDLYQTGATQLSAIKTQAGSTAQGDRLSILLSAARLRFTGASANILSQLPRFFAAQLPAALYRLRWLTLAVALTTAVVAGLFAWWALANPQVLANVGSSADLKQLVNHSFVNY